MEYLNGFLWICILLFSSMVEGQQLASNKSTEKELLASLRTLLEQNRRLTAQNNQLQGVWQRMLQMCNALNVPKCSCNDNGITNTTTLAVASEVSKTIRIVAVASNGLSDNSVTLSIAYIATVRHTTEWLVLRKNGGMWRTGGTNVTVAGSNIYSSKLTIDQFSGIRTLYFRLYNNDESINIRLNTSSAQTAQQTNIPHLRPDYLTVNRSYTVEKDTDLNITAIVKERANKYSDFTNVEIFFTGLNTSANPPATFEITSFGSDGIGLSITRATDAFFYMIITLKYSYAQFGGILTLRMPHMRNFSFFLVSEIYYGPFIKVLSSEGNYVIAPNSLGIFPWSKQTVIFPVTHSIFCVALGNPRPEVSILKMVKESKSKELATETVISDTYINMQVLTLSTSNPEENEGRYVCRATNGNQSMEERTEVIILQPAIIVEAKATNITNAVLASCTARGHPKPELSLRLYDENGPDLASNGLYKVWRSDLNTTTSHLTLVISPIDPDVHTVVCLSSQEGSSGTYEVSSKIHIFGGKHTHNLDLYRKHTHNLDLYRK